MTTGYEPPPRVKYTRKLLDQIAPEVLARTMGNGSLRIAIDTDVYPWGYAEGDPQREEFESWVRYMVLSTLNRLIDKEVLKVPDETVDNHPEAG